MTFDTEGEGFWADRDKIRLVVKRRPDGSWAKWLLVPSSGGSLYRAAEGSLPQAKQSLAEYAAEFLKGIYALEALDIEPLTWHPIGAERCRDASENPGLGSTE